MQHRRGEQRNPGSTQQGWSSPPVSGQRGRCKRQGGPASLLPPAGTTRLSLGLWHPLRVTPLSHRVSPGRSCPGLAASGCPWTTTVLSRPVPSRPSLRAGRLPTLRHPCAGERRLRGSGQGPAPAPRMRGADPAKWRSWRSKCGIEGRMEDMRHPPPSVGLGQPRGWRKRARDAGWARDAIGM